MKYVTLKMIAAHVGRTVQAVNYALKRSKFYPGRTPGVHGLRLPLAKANDFIALHWPEVAPMGANQEPTQS